VSGIVHQIYVGIYLFKFRSTVCLWHTRQGCWPYLQIQGCW